MSPAVISVVDTTNYGSAASSLADQSVMSSGSPVSGATPSTTNTNDDLLLLR